MGTGGGANRIGLCDWIERGPRERAFSFWRV